jgi:hypothetical protein
MPEFYTWQAWSHMSLILCLQNNWVFYTQETWSSMLLTLCLRNNGSCYKLSFIHCARAVTFLSACGGKLGRKSRSLFVSLQVCILPGYVDILASEGKCWALLMPQQDYEEEKGNGRNTHWQNANYVTVTELPILFFIENCVTLLIISQPSLWTVGLTQFLNLETLSG